MPPLSLRKRILGHAQRPEPKDNCRPGRQNPRSSGPDKENVAPPQRNPTVSLLVEDDANDEIVEVNGADEIQQGDPRSPFPIQGGLFAIGEHEHQIQSRLVTLDPPIGEDPCSPKPNGGTSPATNHLVHGMLRFCCADSYNVVIGAFRVTSYDGEIWAHGRVEEQNWVWSRWEGNGTECYRTQSPKPVDFTHERFGLFNAPIEGPDQGWTFPPSPDTSKQ